MILLVQFLGLIQWLPVCLIISWWTWRFITTKILNFYHLTLEILKHFCLINTCNYCVHTSGYGTVVCTMFMDSRAETTPLVICVTRLQKKKPWGKSFVGVSEQQGRRGGGGGSGVNRVMITEVCPSRQQQCLNAIQPWQYSINTPVKAHKCKHVESDILSFAIYSLSSTTSTAW